MLRRIVRDLANFPPVKTNTIFHVARSGCEYLIGRNGKYHRSETGRVFTTWPREKVYTVDMSEFDIEVKPITTKTLDDREVHVGGVATFAVWQPRVLCFEVKEPLILAHNELRQQLNLAMMNEDSKTIESRRDKIEFRVFRGYNLNTNYDLRITAFRMGLIK